MTTTTGTKLNKSCPSIYQSPTNVKAIYQKPTCCEIIYQKSRPAASTICKKLECVIGDPEPLREDSYAIIMVQKF